MRSIRSVAKSVLQHLALVLLPLGAALVGVEIFLVIDGRYNSLAAHTLVPSPAIWEPAPNSTADIPHPDLKVTIAHRIDAQGVHNHSEPSTERKHNIIGVFGDSFTENRRIEDRFAFTSLLDSTTGARARVVNYGVDAYGMDQAYLRYKKYEQHDIRHVVYVFVANDLRNLYETGLTELTPDGEVVFKTPAASPVRRFLGRLRITYLVLSAYHQIQGTPQEPGGGDEEGGVKSEYKARFHDAFADAVVRDLLKQQPRAETTQLARTFLVLLRKWQQEVTARGRTFTVLVVPRELESEIARKLLKEFDGRVIHLQQDFGDYQAFRFKNDSHWNEYGNLQVAQVIAGNPMLPFHEDFMNPGFLDGWKSRIEEYYREHR